MTKKQLIIKAFEELDVGMLDVLLNEDMSYQDVPKQTFVNALRKYYQDVAKYEDLKFDFKAYKGKCEGCQKGKTGYSFVNSDGECYMSLVFVENENDFSDIYKCGKFKADNVEIVNDWVGIFFYEDEKIDFVHSWKTLQEEKECLRAVEEIENELSLNGVLCSDFYLSWYNKYSHLDPMKRIFEKKSYKYTLKAGQYVSSVKNVVEDILINNLAKSFYLEFLDFPLISKDLIYDWLIRADFKFPYAKYGFGYKCHFNNDYFEDCLFRFQLSEMYYYHSLSELLYKYFEWIPENNPLCPSDEFELQFGNDGELPF